MQKINLTFLIRKFHYVKGANLISKLAYRKSGESVWNTLTSMMVKAINVVQGKGSSTEDVMSQKAVKGFWMN